MDDQWYIAEQRNGPVSHVLVFEEVVASEREDLVADAVEFLPTVRGVTAVEHVERDIVEIDAPGVPGAHLTARLRRWWEKAAGEQRDWMVAMNRAARAVGDLAPAFKRDGRRFTRVVDDELTHTIALDHGFGRAPGEHTISVSTGVRIALPGREEFCSVAYHSLDLADGPALAELITGHVLPALDALPSVDSMLERWRQDRSIAPDGRRPYPVGEELLHGRVLVARGRLPEAHVVHQHHYERTQPRQRPYVLDLVAQLGVAPLTTGVNPRLSVADEAALRAWETGVAGRTELLHRLTGVPLDSSRDSLDEVWNRMRETPGRFRAALAGDTPALPEPYYGVHIRGEIHTGRVPFEPWFRVTVELLTAYLGAVVIGRAPGTAWAFTGDGELGMVLRGGTGLLSRVLRVAHLPFDGLSDSEFDPRRLRRLADDMVRWLADGRYDPQMERPGGPEQPDHRYATPR